MKQSQSLMQLTLIISSLCEMVENRHKNVENTRRLENVVQELLVNITNAPKENQQLLMHLHLLR